MPFTMPKVSAGNGPHALKANCPECGSFMQWLSRLTPAERAARREQARLEAMATLAPTESQLYYLRALGDASPAPANRAEASARIEQLKRERGLA